MYRVIALGSIVMLLPLGAHAAAPAELLNRTITVSYTVTIPGEAEDGTRVPGIRNTTRTIYVSTAGRIFARVTRQDGRLAATKEAAPNEPANTLRFVGSQMVGVMPFIRGASQMTISFGPGAQSCSASLVVGKDAGQALTWKGVNGRTYRAIGPASVSNVSCSVAPGNAFAQ